MSAIIYSESKMEMIYTFENFELLNVTIYKIGIRYKIEQCSKAITDEALPPNVDIRENNAFVIQCPSYSPVVKKNRFKVQFIQECFVS